MDDFSGRYFTPEMTLAPWNVARTAHPRACLWPRWVNPRATTFQLLRNRSITPFHFKGGANNLQQSTFTPGRPLSISRNVFWMTTEAYSIYRLIARGPVNRQLWPPRSWFARLTRSADCRNASLNRILETTRVKFSKKDFTLVRRPGHFWDDQKGEGVGLRNDVRSELQTVGVLTTSNKLISTRPEVRYQYAVVAKAVG